MHLDSTDGDLKYEGGAKTQDRWIDMTNKGTNRISFIGLLDSYNLSRLNPVIVFHTPLYLKCCHLNKDLPLNFKSLCFLIDKKYKLLFFYKKNYTRNTNLYIIINLSQLCSLAKRLTFCWSLFPTPHN